MMHMNGKLIIIEGGDGSGKATQTAMLVERLAAEGRPVRSVSFPDYDSDSSALVKMYLRGDFGGDADGVNPYAASAFTPSTASRRTRRSGNRFCRTAASSSPTAIRRATCCIR